LGCSAVQTAWGSEPCLHGERTSVFLFFSLSKKGNPFVSHLAILTALEFPSLRTKEIYVKHVYADLTEKPFCRFLITRGRKKTLSRLQNLEGGFGVLVVK